jgi:SAM-dependent methyltransferase
MMEKMPEPNAEDFDEWYSDMVESPTRDAIVQRYLGLPPSLLSTSLLTWDAIGDIEQALRLAPGDTVLDLACGRGGWGLEIADRTGAQLVGVDFSAEGVRQATGLAKRLGRDAHFVVGDLAATGLDDASISAVLCIDAIQFARDPAAAYAEIRRVLVPHGRAVLTGWIPVNPSDERVLERLRRVDMHAVLTSTGFLDIDIREQPSWQAAERALWEAAAVIEPGGDPALQSLSDEAKLVLPDFELTRRVMVVATAPPGPKS